MDDEIPGRGRGRILYYDLVPVREEPEDPGAFRILSAAVVQCLATGRTLDGMGGPGHALAPEVVDALDMRKTGGGPRMILDAADFDRIHAALVAAGEGLADPGKAEAACAAVAAALDSLDIKTLPGGDA